MKRMMALGLVALALAALPAHSQILLVTGDYRVVSVDQDNWRIGVALADANPNRRQNWVYITPDTRIALRVWKGRWYRDEVIGLNRFFEIVRKGQRLRVHGGRDWDGTIKAKKIWM